MLGSLIEERNKVIGIKQTTKALNQDRSKSYLYLRMRKNT